MDNVNFSPTICSHSNHLFDHPLCENQSLLQRVLNVFFHVFTLGIPLAIYHIYSCCYSNRDTAPKENDFKTEAAKSVKQEIKNKPILNSAALKKAEEAMEKEIGETINKEYGTVSKTINILIEKNLSIKPSIASLFDNLVSLLALEINTIWAKHNLKTLEKFGDGIKKETVYKVLEPFIEVAPWLRRVKDLIVSSS